jgi:hypothetical protein
MKPSEHGQAQSDAITAAYIRATLEASKRRGAQRGRNREGQPAEDPYKPEGEQKDIEAVHEALLRFGPTQGVTLPLDEVFELIARKFNEASATKAPRPKAVRESLDSVAKAAKTLAGKLENLGPDERRALLGGVMLRISGLLRGPLPDDDRSVAFAPEIDAADRRHDESRYDDRQFLKPMVERLTALSLIAEHVGPQAHRRKTPKRGQGADNRKRRGSERGGDVTILSERGVGSAKEELVKDCFWLLYYYFGWDVAKQKISGTAFLNLVTKMFNFAVGKKYPNEDFERSRRNVVEGLKSEEWRRTFMMRPSPLDGMVILRV